MNVIAEYRVRSPTLLLSPAMTAVPDMFVEVEQHTANESGYPTLFFWATGGDFETFEAAMDDDDTVASWDLLDEADGRTLYRVQFSVMSFYSPYREAAAKILEMKGIDGEWYARMRFPSQEEFRRYQSYYLDSDVDFHLERIYSDEKEPTQAEFGLTPVQYETLLLAYDRGYFDEPRRTSLEELAAELDVSTQAVAGRLRRGHANLIENTLDSTRPRYEETLATADEHWWPEESVE